MRRAALPLLALLAACSGTPSDRGDSTIANAAGPRPTEMAARLQSQNPNLTTTPGAEAASTSPATAGVAAPLAIDTNRRREHADVYVDLKDPNGQKSLVYYLMKPEEWHIEKVTQLTPTTKHWRFWRVARTDGKAMPEVDPLRPRR